MRLWRPRLLLILLAVLAVSVATAGVAAAAPSGTAAPSAPAAPAAPVRICNQPILNSPWYYDGGASTFTSGQYPGLPTFGAAGTDFPAATSGMIVPAGNNTAAGNAGTYNVNNTVVYFEPGQHIMAGTYTGNNSDYVGGYTAALGSAVINGVDGGTGGTGVGGSTFTASIASSGHNVYDTWEYLTIENFLSTVNGGVIGDVNGGGFSNGDTYKYDTIGPNLYGYTGNTTAPSYGESSGGGYGIDGSADTTIEYDCVTQDAQGGFNITNGLNLVVANSEISSNGLGVYPDVGGPGGSPYSCGCSGGGKVFFSLNADIVNDYIHDNYNSGVWFDFGNAGGDVSHNYIASNWAAGITEEGSYNANISANTVVGNGWASNGAWPEGVGGLPCYGGVSCTNGLGPIEGGGGGLPFGAIAIENSGGNPNMDTVSVPAQFNVPGCASNCTVTSRYRQNLTITGNVLSNNFGGVFLYTDTDRYPGNIDQDSSCGQPLSALTQANSATYYQQNKNVETANDVTISGNAVTSTAGTFAFCSNYGDIPPTDFGDNTSFTQAPSAGMGVWNMDTGAYLGNVATVTSATAFTLNGSPGNVTGARVYVGAYGGCGPADYAGGGPGVTSGTPAALYWDNCIWGTRNVTVSGNSFTANGDTITGCTLANLCGLQTDVAFNAGVPLFVQFFDAYPSLTAKASGGLGDVFSRNSYTWTGGGPGSWQFSAGPQGTGVTWAQWLAAPYGQDNGSTFSP